MIAMAKQRLYYIQDGTMCTTENVFSMRHLYNITTLPNNKALKNSSCFELGILEGCLQIFSLHPHPAVSDCGCCPGSSDRRTLATGDTSVTGGTWIDCRGPISGSYWSLSEPAFLYHFE